MKEALLVFIELNEAIKEQKKDFLLVPSNWEEMENIDNEMNYTDNK